jgi:hypothetical protein
MLYQDQLQGLRDLTKKFGDPIQNTIYHYTSMDGFRGIVASSELWLTNAAFVNDTTDCIAFLEEDCGGRLLKDGRLTNEAVKETLNNRLEDGRRNDNYYIASFSKEPDYLPQYQAYGSVCIGFDPQRMGKRRFSFYECVYAEEEIRNWVCDKSVLPDWGKLCDGDSRHAAPDLCFAAQVKYKNQSFRNEREVRMLAESYHTWEPGDYVKALSPNSWADMLGLIHADDPPIHVRGHSISGIPIPYVKFFVSADSAMGGLQDETPGETEAQMKRRKLKEEEGASRELLPVTEVWIGPMAHQEKVKLACEIMLRQKGYEGVCVQASKIPYRGTLGL